VEKISTTKSENWRLRAFLSDLWKRRMASKHEANKAEKTMSWRRYERRKAREHRGQHVGGAGREDYRRGKVKGEVKHMKRPMSKPEVMKACGKGIREIESLKGYTKPAIEYAIRYCPNLKLFHRGRRVA